MAKTIELTDDNFRSAIEEHEIALVDMFASWCGPCKLFSPIFDKVAETSSYAFFKIDGDKNPQSRQELKIDNLPFVAVYRNGKFFKGVSTSTESGLKELLAELGESQ